MTFIDSCFFVSLCEVPISRLQDGIATRRPGVGKESLFPALSLSLRLPFSLNLGLLEHCSPSPALLYILGSCLCIDISSFSPCWAALKPVSVQLLPLRVIEGHTIFSSFTQRVFACELVLSASCSACFSTISILLYFLSLAFRVFSTDCPLTAPYSISDQAWLS